MSTLADPAAFIAQAPFSSATYARVYRPEAHTDFFIREESRVIACLSNPVVVLQAAMVIERDVALVAVLLGLGIDNDFLYETWWNYHQADGKGVEHFHDMATQDHFAMHFYGDHGTKEKSVRVNNSIKPFFQSVLEKMTDMPAWRMDAFDQAREAIYQGPLSVDVLLKKA